MREQTIFEEIYNIPIHASRSLGLGLIYQLTKGEHSIVQSTKKKGGVKPRPDYLIESV